jgi:hypothetical protein
MQRHLQNPPPEDSGTPYQRYPVSWAAPVLGRIWHLSVSPKMRLKTLQGALAPILKRLEEVGDTREKMAVLDEVPHALKVLGVVDVSSRPADPGGGAIWLLEPGIRRARSVL